MDIYLLEMKMAIGKYQLLSRATVRPNDREARKLCSSYLKRPTSRQDKYTQRAVLTRQGEELGELHGPLFAKRGFVDIEMEQRAEIQATQLWALLQGLG